MRPALFTNGPRSLINLIDTGRLVRHGQGDAIVRFHCFVGKHGEGYGLLTFMGTPHSEGLADEAVVKGERATFYPAIYKSQPVDSIINGTIVFVVIDGKPHLRIYLNQDEKHFMRGDDFIAPQQVFPPYDNSQDYIYPNASWLSGRVAISLETDATGKVLDSKVAFESPTGAGFGKAVMERIHTLTFLPGFLHGKPVACTTTWQQLFRGRRHGNHWDTDSN